MHHCKIVFKNVAENIFEEWGVVFSRPLHAILQIEIRAYYIDVWFSNAAQIMLPNVIMFSKFLKFVLYPVTCCQNGLGLVIIQKTFSISFKVRCIFLVAQRAQYA